MNIETIRSKWPFEIEPREVQLEALAAGYDKPGFAYFMRQRLGKTWTAYGEFEILKKENKVDWFIVICPNSLKEQWREAIESVNPFTPICVYESSSKAKVLYYFTYNQKGGVFIINYESAKAFIDYLLEDSSNPVFSPERAYLTIDESTKIKDPAAKMTKAVHKLAALCSYKRVLSGKPKANSNADMWGQLKAIDATEYNYYQFKFRYTLNGGFRGTQFHSNINTEELKSKMEPYCYIAPDKYIKGFQKIYEPMRKVTLPKELQALYKKMEDDLLFNLSSDVKITAPIALTRYLRLQQISSGIAGDENSNQHNLIEPSQNPRIKVTREILDNEIDHKVIIPCRFILSGLNLKNILERDGHKCAMLFGADIMKKLSLEVTSQKQLFNEGDYDVLIGQLQTLSFGHTLPGPDDNPCDSIIFYENDFSLINRMQSESRPEKFERDIPISCYDMYSSKMDRYMLQSLTKKEDASMALMGYSRAQGLRPELSNDESLPKDTSMFENIKAP